MLFRSDHRLLLQSKVPEFVAAFAQTKEEVAKQRLNPLLGDCRMRFLSVLRKLLHDNRTILFWAPVELPGYSSIIKQPKDLGTITKGVLEGRYDLYANEADASSVLPPTMQCAFADDVRLVWSNCQTYNPPATLIHQYALQLHQLFSELFYEWAVSESRPRFADIPVSGSEK